jgi:hypothetical protein
MVVFKRLIPPDSIVLTEKSWAQASSVLLAIDGRGEHLAYLLIEDRIHAAPCR